MLIIQCQYFSVLAKRTQFFLQEPSYANTYADVETTDPRMSEAGIPQTYAVVQK